METGQVFSSKGPKSAKAGDGAGDDDDDDDQTGEGKEGGGGNENGGDSKQDDKEDKLSGYEKRLQKKERLKQLFNSEYDGQKDAYDAIKAQLEEQARFNRSEFAGDDDASRVQFEGFRPGLYVRMELHDLPCELIDNFNPAYPVIVGGLAPTELVMGFIQLRFKRHRFFKKTLKSRDPLVFSLGWRRFQSVPIYAVQDQTFRNRMLKYTPQHTHCVASLFGKCVID